ncbi:unnamed protein product, partial [Trichobilharzia regenti]
MSSLTCNSTLSLTLTNGATSTLNTNITSYYYNQLVNTPNGSSTNTTTTTASTSASNPPNSSTLYSLHGNIGQMNTTLVNNLHFPSSSPSSSAPPAASSLLTATPASSSTGLIVSPSVHRNLSILLHIIRLYVSGKCGSKSNSSILGRSGAISLVIRLISLISGLHLFKPITPDITSLPTSSSSSVGGAPTPTTAVTATATTN